MSFYWNFSAVLRNRDPTRLWWWYVTIPSSDQWWLGSPQSASKMHILVTSCLLSLLQAWACSSILLSLWLVCAIGRSQSVSRSQSVRLVSQIMRQTSQYKACICGISCIYEVDLHLVSETCQNWALLIRKVALFIKKKNYPFL